MDKYAGLMPVTELCFLVIFLGRIQLNRTFYYLTIDLVLLLHMRFLIRYTKNYKQNRELTYSSSFFAHVKYRLVLQLNSCCHVRIMLLTHIILEIMIYAFRLYLLSKRSGTMPQ